MDKCNQTIVPSWKKQMRAYSVAQFTLYSAVICTKITYV